MNMTIGERLSRMWWNLISNYLLVFLFEKTINVEFNNILVSSDDYMFELDNLWGNPNRVKRIYHRLFGNLKFTMFIKTKSHKSYCISEGKWIDNPDYWLYNKSNIRMATIKEVNLFKEMSILRDAKSIYERNLKPLDDIDNFIRYYKRMNLEEGISLDDCFLMWFGLREFNDSDLFY